MDDLLKSLDNLRANLELFNSNKRSINNLRVNGKSRGLSGKSIPELEKENSQVKDEYINNFSVLENALKETQDWTLLSNGTMVWFNDDQVLHYRDSNINGNLFKNNLFEKNLLIAYTREI